MKAYLTYDLIVIEDSATPLAPSMIHTNYYTLTIIAMVMIAAVLFLIRWTLKRQKLVERLKELNSSLGRESNIPLSIKSIEDEIALAETDLSALML